MLVNRVVTYIGSKFNVFLVERVISTFTIYYSIAILSEREIRN